MNNISIRGDAPPQDALEGAKAIQSYLDQNELREAFRKVWRRRKLVFATMTIMSTLTLVVLVEVTPRYTGAASVIVDPRNQRVVDVQSVLEGASKDSEAVYSEAEILTSRQLIGKLVDKLDLINNPEFNVALRPPSATRFLNPFNWLPDEWRDAILGRDAELSPEQKKIILHNQVVDAAQKRLKVAPKTRTRVVNIDFQSEDRDIAMNGANSLAELYLTSQLDEKFEATQRVSTWLNDRLAELRKKVDESERAVEAYRASAGLINTYRAGGGVMGGKGTTIVEQQIADLTGQMTIARTDRATADSKLKQIKEIISASPHGEDSVAEVLDSPLIQHLREQEGEIERSIADLSQQYGDRHPKLIAAHAQLTDIQAKIAGEVRKIILALENAANVARARESAIASQLEDLKRQVISSSSAEVKLRQLEMEAQSNRTLMESFLARFKETSAQESGNLQMPDARIVSRADYPERPSFPKIPLFMAIEIFLSAVIGVILAFVAEHLDRGFRSGVQFEHETGTPVLAMIPQVDESKGRAADYLVERPMSSYAEAVRSVYTSLLLTQGTERMKSIVVSSCQPSEGKSTLAFSLTRMIALSGHKVILIEADLRRPSIHYQLGIERGIGLAEVLIGSASFDDAIYRDPKTDADILLAGKETLNPSKLLASHQMDQLLAKLTAEYDAVIIDTAPVLAVSDGLLLANKADGTIYSCRWATTSRETASLGLKELREANAKIVGAVISVVNTKKSQTYGYADTSYYYYARKYYSETE
jgi:capsular exopolysaccharide synthesis family protein